MTSTQALSGLELISRVTADGQLELSLARRDIPEPGAGQVVVRVEASPINPSDLGLLLGPADISAATVTGSGASAVLTAPIPAPRMKTMAARLDQPMQVGNEGAGVVVKAGAGAEDYLGKTVALLGGAMYAQYRLAKAADCMVLPEGTTPRQGASPFVNPLTALGMVETMRREGHTALIHTAAASNLGQMLNRICLGEGVGLVNIVRTPEQADLLLQMGAAHVVDSSAPDFMDDLTDALATTGATIAFDAIGGGDLANTILIAMEAAANRKAGAYNRYGSATMKQVYIYGGLDTRPTVLDRSFGMSWATGGWLLTYFLQKIGPEAAKALRERVASELTTTFASHYTAEISLADVLNPEIAVRYQRKSTGEKFLINPSL